MKIEVRTDGVHIEGYVNAVDRFSRVMRAEDGSTFIEKITPGAFDRAIEQADKIEIKHNHKRVIGSSLDEGVKIKEDSIGLYCEGFFKDSEIVERAKKGELVGWSFGFIPKKMREEESKKMGVDIERSVDELELHEVSIIDKRQLPCYVGTSIEVRSEENKELRLRGFEDDFKKSKKEDYSLKKKRLKLLKL